jgi:hypothetical protein
MRFTIGYRGWSCQSMTLGSADLKSTWGIYAPKPEHPEKVKALIAAEYKRREKNRKKTSQASGRRRHNEGERAGEVLG